MSDHARRHSAVSCAIRLNRSRCRLECGLRWTAYPSPHPKRQVVSSIVSCIKVLGWVGSDWVTQNGPMDNSDLFHAAAATTTDAIAIFYYQQSSVVCLSVGLSVCHDRQPCKSGANKILHVTVLLLIYFCNQFVASVSRHSRHHCSVCQCQQSTWYSATRTRFF